jgi:ferredoxin
LDKKHSDDERDLSQEEELAHYNDEEEDPEEQKEALDSQETLLLGKIPKKEKKPAKWKSATPKPRYRGCAKCKTCIDVLQTLTCAMPTRRLPSFAVMLMAG